MNKFDFFWGTMQLCDWNHEGDDEKVLQPVVNYLSTLDDHKIFEFDNHFMRKRKLANIKIFGIWSLNLYYMLQKMLGR